MLHLAVCEGNTEAVELLLQHSANVVHIKNKDGLTALDMGTGRRQNTQNTRILDLLNKAAAVQAGIAAASTD